MLNYFKGEWSSRTPNVKSLNSFLSLGKPLCLYDLGASGGTPPPFCWIADGLLLVNFEPDSRASLVEGRRNYNIAIGPSEMRTLYINYRQTTSSLLPPCKEVVNRYDFSAFPEGQKIFETVSQVEIETLGLDQAITEFEIPPPDFLKIDVQGLTYEVLETARDVLSQSVLGLQVEAEFIETYSGQKTFSAIHDFLTEYDFEIFRLSHLCQWKYLTSKPLKMRTGQDVYCDFLYLRSLRHVDRYPEFWTSDRIVQYLKICLLYDLTDTAAAFLDKFIEKGLIDTSSSCDLEKLIVSWGGALDYFYHPSKSVAMRKKLFQDACILMLKSLLPVFVYSKIVHLYNKMAVRS